MSIIDIERLLQDDSVGRNLEDDSIFYHFERLLQGKKEILDSDAKTILVQAEPPSWTEALDLAKDLLGQSKDLRIAVGLTRCLIALYGLVGCEIGFKLLSDMLEKYWDHIYPVPEDEDDYIVRINALSPLNDWSETLFFLTQSSIFNTKSNKLTIRIFGLVANKLQPKENEQILSPTQIKYVMAEIPQNTKEEVSLLIEKIMSYISLIRKKYDQTIGIVPDFSALLGVLNWIRPYLVISEKEDVNVNTQQVISNEVINLESAVEKKDKKLVTREDAIAVLEEICVFLEQSEPAHPAPLFIRRGQKLLGMNFLEIVKELSPDAYDEVCKLGGVSQDD